MNSPLPCERRDRASACRGSDVAEPPHVTHPTQGPKNSDLGEAACQMISVCTTLAGSDLRQASDVTHDESQVVLLPVNHDDTHSPGGDGFRR